MAEKENPNSSVRNGKTVKWDRESLSRAMQAVQEAKKGMDIYHVIWHEGERWGVLREGNKRLSKILDDKQAAVKHAKRLVHKSPKWKVVVHKQNAGLDRLISSENS